MRGVIFTEFLDMVEERYSEDMVDNIIDASDLSTEGAYTSIGTYNKSEFVQLIGNLSQQTGVQVPQLLEQTGRHLFRSFVRLQPEFFAGLNCCFDFVVAFEGFLHADIRRLYNDNELPGLKTTFLDEKTLKLQYISVQKFKELMEGLIRECIEYFKEKIDLEIEDHSAADTANVDFILRKA